MNGGTPPCLRFLVIKTRPRTANIKPYLKKGLNSRSKEYRLTPHPRLIYTNDFKTLLLCCTDTK